MRAVLLDFGSIDFNGEISLKNLSAEIPSLDIYDQTRPDQVVERVRDAEIIITNKVLIDENILSQAKSLKLVCIAATGINNIDIVCKQRYKLLNF